MDAKELPPNIPGTNSGHGHVWKRPDGLVGRCGGPAFCRECKTDQKLVGEQYLPTVNLEELEKLAVKQALEKCGGNRTHAVTLLGISARTIQRKLRRWGWQDRVALGSNAKPST